MDKKRSIQMAVRQLHKIVALRPIPNRIGLYFHSLEKSQYAAFSDCIRFWTERNYRFVNAEDFVRQEGERLLFVSFDDNYRSWYAALPLLDSLNAKVMFYINTLPIRGKAEQCEIDNYFSRIEHKGEQITLSEKEISEISAAGHTIGCHSHSHFDLGAVPEEVAKAEILTSKKILEEIIQSPVTDFSYPFGMRRNFTKKLRDFCLQSGFRTVCNATPGRLHGIQTSHSINRSSWNLEQSLEYNIENIQIDGRFFEWLTGRSAIG
jgi:peptidoglycan/xylan/chitin deacetylase (PgdA/CDA1 family)